MPMSKSTYYFELTKVDLVDKRNTELKDEIQNSPFSLSLMSMTTLFYFKMELAMTS